MFISFLILIKKGSSISQHPAGLTWLFLLPLHCLYLPSFQFSNSKYHLGKPLKKYCTSLSRKYNEKNISDQLHLPYQHPFYSSALNCQHYQNLINWNLKSKVSRLMCWSLTTERKYLDSIGKFHISLKMKSLTQFNCFHQNWNQL
mgnify:CR=1 FL=1